MSALTIYTEFDGESYVLMCANGITSDSPAGPRIFRAPPWPDIQFSHPTIDAAESDARKLRVYLAGLSTKKVSKKRTMENAA